MFVLALDAAFHVDNCYETDIKEGLLLLFNKKYI